MSALGQCAATEGVFPYNRRDRNRAWAVASSWEVCVLLKLYAVEPYSHVGTESGRIRPHLARECATLSAHIEYREWKERLLDTNRAWRLVSKDDQGVVSAAHAVLC